MNPNNISTRSKQCMPDLLDLTERYGCSANTAISSRLLQGLSDFPSGLQYLASVAFDARGIVIPEEGKEETVPEPLAVWDAPLPWRRMHMLHGMETSTQPGEIVGYYIIVYEDGLRESIPIRFGEDIGNSFAEAADKTPVKAVLAYRSTAGLPKKEKDHETTESNFSLFRFTVNNPMPDKPIHALLFTKGSVASAPFLLAVTIEPVETIYLGFFDGTKPVNSLMKRNRWTHPDLINLDAYYTAALSDDFHFHEGHDLQDLPQGIQMYGGVAFDVRGLIQLAAGNISLRRTGAVYHESVSDIMVGRFADMIHFLHACGWSCEEGKIVGYYTIKYQDGSNASIPLVYGLNVVDWWENPETKLDENTEVVWKGNNAFCRNLGVRVQVLKFSWKNPKPGIAIETISMSSTLETAGLFLVALTLESNQSNQ